MITPSWIWRVAGEMLSCPYCGGMQHQYIGQCPAVKKIEYYPDGSIKSVEKQ